MGHVFELFITKDKVLSEDFNAFYTALSGYLGSFKTIRFHILLKENHVRYFVESDRDISAISSSITFCTLKPVEPEEAALPTHSSKERFVSFVTGGTLLDLREKTAVKRGKTLEHFLCDVQKITSNNAHTTIKMFFKDAGGQWSLAKKLTSKFPAHLFAFDFTIANNFMKSETPNYLNIEKVLHMIMPENLNALLEVNTFPYFPRPYFLPLPAFEFDKHSMIVGASGSGKSKFIELLIDRIYRLPNRNNYRIVVIDPHANLANDLKVIQGSKIIDFNNDSPELFAGAEADITAATELTTTLMKSLMGDSFNPRVERVLRFTLYVLFTAQNMALGNMKRFLNELEYRQQILDHVEDHIPHNIVKFFATDYNEIRTAFYNEGLLPIIAIIDELELQPTFLQEGGLSIQKTINDNFLTVFSLNKVSMGEKVVKTVAGLIIQQIFLLAQSRAFGQRVILIIDEVSVVQNPALAAILSEARKYNLFVILTQQYFAQVDKTLRDAIFANVYNYYCFRVAEEDAAQLIGNLPMELPKQMLIDAKAQGVSEEIVKKRMLTELHPRECIVRVSSNGLLLPCFKARTVDVKHSIETYVEESFEPKEYKGTPVSLEEFFKKADAVPVGVPVTLSTEHRIDNSHSTESVQTSGGSLEKFKEVKQDDLPALDTVEIRTPDPPAPPLQELPTQPDTQPAKISLDDIMKSNSSKGNKE